MRKKLLTIFVVGCLMAFAGSASANSVTLSQSGGIGPSTYTVSSTITVTLFANLTGFQGGGQHLIGVDLVYDTLLLTATVCREEHHGTYLLGTEPEPHFGQVIGGVGVYEPYLRFPVHASCGLPGGSPGSPADGGLTTPGVVRLIAQERVLGSDATSGTLILGHVRFHVAATTFIDSDFGLGGFLGSDFVNRTTGALGTLTVIIPEPTMLVGLGSGIAGLLLIGRHRARR